MVSSSKNLYEILNVSSKASFGEIKSAYKKMVRIYHPDINKEPGAEIQFKLLNNAYSVLSDIEKRKNYDNLLSVSKPVQNKKRADKNSIIKEVKITEIEAKEGTTRVVNILNTQFCPKCMGAKFLNGIKCAFCKGEGEKKELKQIEVEIKSGVKNNELIYVGKVNSSALYDKNLFLKIIIEPLKKLYFENNKIYFDVDIPLYDAILGKEIEVNIPNLGLYKLNIPQLSKNGDKIKLDIKNGEFYAVINVIFPEKLSKEELKLFEKLKKLNQAKDIYEFAE